MTEAAVGPGAGADAFAVGGGADGPLVMRQGKPMRPVVAQAFDRMASAAREDGVELLIFSAYWTDAEQPSCSRATGSTLVARPGTSLDRFGTEVGFGPESAYGWLAANARRFPLHPALPAPSPRLSLRWTGAPADRGSGVDAPPLSSVAPVWYDPRRAAPSDSKRQRGAAHSASHCR